MITSLIGTRGLKLVAAAAIALSIAACSTKPGDETAGLAGGGLGAGGYGAGAGGRGGAGAPGSAGDFTVNVGDRVFFETDSSDLTATATATLDKQAAWLARYPRHAILLEGHADERGTREYNFSLGARRAQTVRDYLSSRGVQGTRIRTVSYGKERPVAACPELSCQSQNRRAVTVLEGGAGL